MMENPNDVITPGQVQAGPLMNPAQQVAQAAQAGLPDPAMAMSGMSSETIAAAMGTAPAQLEQPQPTPMVGQMNPGQPVAAIPSRPPTEAEMAAIAAGKAAAQRTGTELPANGRFATTGALGGISETSQPQVQAEPAMEHLPRPVTVDVPEDYKPDPKEAKKIAMTLVSKGIDVDQAMEIARRSLYKIDQAFPASAPVKKAAKKAAKKTAAKKRGRPAKKKAEPVVEEQGHIEAATTEVEPVAEPDDQF